MGDPKGTDKSVPIVAGRRSTGRVTASSQPIAKAPILIGLAVVGSGLVLVVATDDDGSEIDRVAETKARAAAPPGAGGPSRGDRPAGKTAPAVAAVMSASAQKGP